MLTLRTPVNRTNDRWMSTPDLNSQHICQPVVLFTATVSAGCCGCSLVTRFAAATCGSSLHTSVLLSRNPTFSQHHTSMEPRPNVLQNSDELLRTAQSWSLLQQKMLGQRAEPCCQKLVLYCQRRVGEAVFIQKEHPKNRKINLLSDFPATFRCSAGIVGRCSGF